MIVDNLLSVDVVVADGRALTASAENHSGSVLGAARRRRQLRRRHLFELELQPVGPTVMAGMVLHPMDQAREVLRFYRDFAAMAPDEVGSMVLLRIVPPAPFLRPRSRQAGGRHRRQSRWERRGG